MKFTAMTFGVLATVSTSHTAQASLRRNMKVQEAQAATLQQQKFVPFEHHSVVEPVFGPDKKMVKPHDDAMRALSSSSQTCIVDSPSQCTPNAACVCPEGYTEKENLRPDLATGCYQCSKAIGEQCSHDTECEWGKASCIQGKCQPTQCSSYGTTSVWGEYTSNYSQSSYNCECSVGEFIVKEELDPERMPGCFHCSKPVGEQCEEEHECEQGKKCIDNICSENPKPQCKNTATVQGNNVLSYCSYEQPDEPCECTAPYSVKEQVMNGCYHCSKPEGEGCSVDHECEFGKACLDNGTCGVPPSPQCPSGNSCTANADCVCQDPIAKQTYTYSNGFTCYYCGN